MPASSIRHDGDSRTVIGAVRELSRFADLIGHSAAKYSLIVPRLAARTTRTRSGIETATTSAFCVVTSIFHAGRPSQIRIPFARLAPCSTRLT
jgi:hypothetical protein